MALKDILAQRQHLIEQIAEIDRQIELAEGVEFINDFTLLFNDVTSGMRTITAALQMPNTKEEAASIRSRLRIALRDQQITIERALDFTDKWTPPCIEGTRISENIVVVTPTENEVTPQEPVVVKVDDKVIAEVISFDVKAPEVEEAETKEVKAPEVEAVPEQTKDVDARILDLVNAALPTQSRVASKFKDHAHGITIDDETKELRVGRIPFNGPERTWLTNYIKKNWGADFVLKGV